MSTQDYYEAKIDVITAILGDRVKKLVNMPMAVYVQEAENLLKWCRQDKVALTARGMPWELVTDLPARIGALRQAESNWRAEYGKKEEPEILWMKKSPTAYRLRNKLLRDFRFAYRADPELLAALKTISSAGGHAAMIQDLNDLGKMGKNHPEPLERVGFDMSQLDRAEALVDELAPLHAATARDRAHANDAKMIRNQAFTHLKETVDEIRRYGRFTFQDNEARKQGYKSEHQSRRNRLRPSRSAAKKTARISPETPSGGDETAREPDEAG